MKGIVLLQTMWYLAVQDGRLDDREFESPEEAEDALRELGDEKKGVCIMNYKKEVESKEFFRDVDFRERDVRDYEQNKNKF